MTPEEVRAKIAVIRQAAGLDPVDPAIGKDSPIRGDYEAAHLLQDSLLVEALEAIAAGHPDPAALAAAALESGELDFPRWCA